MLYVCAELSSEKCFYSTVRRRIENENNSSLSTGHQPLQDIEIRVGNSSVELQRNPLCAWFPGTIGKQLLAY